MEGRPPSPSRTKQKNAAERARETDKKAEGANSRHAQTTPSFPHPLILNDRYGRGLGLRGVGSVAERLSGAGCGGRGGRRSARGLRASGGAERSSEGWGA